MSKSKCFESANSNIFKYYENLVNLLCSKVIQSLYQSPAKCIPRSLLKYPLVAKLKNYALKSFIILVPEAVFLVVCDPSMKRAVSDHDRSMHRSLWV
jgi:hypothetical protein